MKHFLAIYTGTAENSEARWGKLSESQRQERMTEGLKAWHDWAARHKDAIVEMGAPLGKTKRTGPDGISDIRNAMTGYTVVKAESHEAAAKLFENHPHFTIFPGDAVEVMECMPIPGM